MSESNQPENPSAQPKKITTGLFGNKQKTQEFHEKEKGQIDARFGFNNNPNKNEAPKGSGNMFSSSAMTTKPNNIFANKPPQYNKQDPPKSLQASAPIPPPPQPPENKLQSKEPFHEQEKPVVEEKKEIQEHQKVESQNNVNKSKEQSDEPESKNVSKRKGRRNKVQEKIIIRSVEEIQSQIAKKDKQFQQSSQMIQEIQEEIDIKTKAQQKLGQERKRIQKNIKTCSESTVPSALKEKNKFIKQLDETIQHSKKLRQDKDSLYNQFDQEVNKRKGYQIEKQKLTIQLKKMKLFFKLQQDVNTVKRNIKDIYDKFKAKKEAHDTAPINDEKQQIELQLEDLAESGQKLLKERMTLNQQVSGSEFNKDIVLDQQEYDFSVKFAIQLERQSQPKRQQKEEQKEERQQSENKNQKKQQKQEDKVVKLEQKQVQRKQEGPSIIKQVEKKDAHQSSKIQQQEVDLEQKLQQKKQNKSIEEKPQNNDRSSQNKENKVQIKAQPKQQQTNVRKDELVCQSPNKPQSNPPDLKLQQKVLLLSFLTQSLEKQVLSQNFSCKQIEDKIMQKRKGYKLLERAIKDYQDYYNSIRDLMSILDSDVTIRYEQLLQKAKLVSKGKKQFFRKADEQIRDTYDRQEDNEQKVENIKEIIPPVHEDPQPKFKPLYQQSINELKPDLGPHFLRFALMNQKYLNQLRIIIQLFGISDQELEKNHFDRKKYEELVSKKITLLQQCELPAKIDEHILCDERYITLMDQMDEIQAQIAPLQDHFDERYVRGLYKIPQQNLKMTKQHLFEVAYMNRLIACQKELEFMEKGTAKLQSQLNALSIERKNLQRKNNELEKQKNKAFVEHKKQVSKKFFPGEEDNKLIKNEEFQPEYNVLVTNEKLITASYQELNRDTKLKQIKEQYEALVQERLKEKDEKIKAKKEYCKAIDNKKKKQKMQVYMGDSAKVNNDPRVQQLKKRLEELRGQLIALDQKQNKPTSKISQTSQIRISYILE